MPYSEIYQPVPAAGQSLDEAVLLSASGQAHDKIEVYTGTRAIGKFGIDVEGSGASTQGKMDGTLKSNDYKKLYTIYNLKSESESGWWVFKNKTEENHDVLKQTFQQSKVIDVHYDLKFNISGNDWGESAVYITYQVIQLRMNGETKDYVVTNNKSAGANNQDGSAYGGKFSAT